MAAHTPPVRGGGYGISVLKSQPGLTVIVVSCLQALQIDIARRIVFFSGSLSFVWSSLLIRARSSNDRKRMEQSVDSNTAGR